MTEGEKLIQTARRVLLAWFVTASVLIFIPAAALLIGAWRYEPPPFPSAPEKPEVAAIPQQLQTPASTNDKKYDEYGKAYDKYIAAQTSLYEKRVNAYKEQVAAWRTSVETTRPLAAYQTVVKDTIVSLVTTLIAALVTYVFATTAVPAVMSFLNNRTEALFRRREQGERV